MKQIASSILAALVLFLLSSAGGAQSQPPKSSDEARRLVIEYRDGTRQTIQLDKDWWEILNVLLPPAPVPKKAEPGPAPPSALTAPAPAPKAVQFDLSGRWVNWRTGENQVYTMRLLQTGKRVRGLHRLDPQYVIDGTLEGHVLKGTWSSPSLVGEFIFEFSEDGNSFKGRWNTTVDLQNWRSGWNGRRQ